MTVASEIARKASAGVTHLQTAPGLNNISNLMARVGVLETQVCQLHDMLKEFGNLMMGIVNGTIPFSVPPKGTGATVTWAESDGFKAEQKRMLRVLEQLIEGGGYTIGSLTFTTVGDLVSYCHHHFPQESYDCIV